MSDVLDVQDPSPSLGVRELARVSEDVLIERAPGARPDAFYLAYCAREKLGFKETDLTIPWLEIHETEL